MLKIQLCLKGIKITFGHIHTHKYFILNCNISQYYCFYCLLCFEKKKGNLGKYKILFFKNT